MRLYEVSTQLGYRLHRLSWRQCEREQQGRSEHEAVRLSWSFSLEHMKRPWIQRERSEPRQPTVTTTAAAGSSSSRHLRQRCTEAGERRPPQSWTTERRLAAPATASFASAASTVCLNCLLASRLLSSSIDSQTHVTATSPPITRSPADADSSLRLPAAWSSTLHRLRVLQLDATVPQPMMALLDSPA